VAKREMVEDAITIQCVQTSVLDVELW